MRRNFLHSLHWISEVLDQYVLLFWLLTLYQHILCRFWKFPDAIKYSCAPLTSVLQFSLPISWFSLALSQIILHVILKPQIWHILRSHTKYKHTVKYSFWDSATILHAGYQLQFIRMLGDPYKTVVRIYWLWIDYTSALQKVFWHFLISFLLIFDYESMIRFFFKYRMLMSVPVEINQIKGVHWPKRT